MIVWKTLKEKKTPWKLAENQAGFPKRGLQAPISPTLSRLLICKLAILPTDNMRDHSIPSSNEPVSLGWLLVSKYYWINKQNKDLEESLVSPPNLETHQICSSPNLTEKEERKQFEHDPVPSSFLKSECNWGKIARGWCCGDESSMFCLSPLDKQGCCRAGFDLWLDLHQDISSNVAQCVRQIRIRPVCF